MKISRNVSHALRRRYTFYFGAQMTIAQFTSVASGANGHQVADLSSRGAPSAMVSLVRHQCTMMILAGSKNTVTSAQVD